MICKICKKENIKILKINLLNKYLNKFYLLYYIILSRIFKNLDFNIRFKIGKKFLFINLQHRLPIYYYKFLNYDRALPRISESIKKIDNRLDFIDIGANIGDTISLITDKVSGNFLCVEGDEKYIPILERNIKMIDKSNFIKLEKCYCGDKNKRDFFISRVGGTAKIVIKNNSELKNIDESIIEIKSLDEIIQINNSFKCSNILKIDTDGFEINVLNSGKFFLKEAKPLIFMEFTPELYIKNNQDPKKIWSILIECGYELALFYNNFGVPVKVIDIKDSKEIKNLIDKINNKEVFYYDVLLCHKNKSKYLQILTKELSFFKNK